MMLNGNHNYIRVDDDDCGFVHKAKYDMLDQEMPASERIDKHPEGKVINVKIVRPDGEARLGVHFDKSNGQTLMITSEPEPGSLLHKWEGPGGEKIEIGDSIVEVNEIVESADLLLNQCQRAPEIRMIVLKGDKNKGSPGSAKDPDREVLQKKGGVALVCEKAQDAADGARQKAVGVYKGFNQDLRSLRGVWWSAAGTVVQWFLPCLAVLGSYMCVSLSSRVATVYYVRYMRQIENLSNRAYQDGHRAARDPADWDATALSKGWLVDHQFDYPQKLQDVVASSITEPLEVSPWVWDVSCMLVPFVCLGLIVLWRDAYLWSKATMSIVLLNLGKAFCCCATVVPDASGWESCKERLTHGGLHPDAVEQMSSMHFDWKHTTEVGMLDLLHAEFLGLRYCGDMLYSGQTFVILLFCLCLRELLWKNFGKSHPKKLVLLNWGVLAPYVLLSSFAALAARYHYTVDVFIAAILTVLIYDWPPLTSACRRWADMVPSVANRDRAGALFMASSTRSLNKAEKTRSWLGLFSLIFGCATYVWSLGVGLLAIEEFYKQDRMVAARMYIGSYVLMGTVCFVLCLGDSDLKKLDEICGPVCLRLPLSLILGPTQLIFVVKKICTYFQEEQDHREIYVFKVVKAGIMGVPATAIQVYGFSAWQTTGASVLGIPTVVINYVNMMLAIYSVGDAIAEGDLAETSVLKNFNGSPVWKTFLDLLRSSEAGARIMTIVVAQHFAEEASPRYGRFLAATIISVDVFVSALLQRCMGASNKCTATLIFAFVTIASNVNLFQKEEPHRRVADVLCNIRMFEFLAMGAAAGYYFKYVPGGIDALVSWTPDHLPIVLTLVVTLVMYFILIVPWLEIRRVNLPKESDDQD